MRFGVPKPSSGTVPYVNVCLFAFLRRSYFQEELAALRERMRAEMAETRAMYSQHLARKAQEQREEESAE